MSAYKPKFQAGQVVQIPTSTPGHDRHKAGDRLKITRVYPGACPRRTSYLLEGSPSLWPETRLAQKRSMRA